MNTVKNLYDILEIDNDAPVDEIRTAFKRLVRIYHPDVNKSADAEINFKLLMQAYHILSDKEKRQSYDKTLTETKAVPNENSIIKEVKITEDEAKTGTTRIVNILNTKMCPKCFGYKRINGFKCAFCHGEGEQKDLKKIETKIPKNIKNGEYIFIGKVNTSALYTKELFLKIIIEPYKKIHKEGQKKIIKIKTPLYDAVLGTSIEIAVKDLGIINLEIPPCSNQNTVIKLDGKENYFASLDVIFPNNISQEEKRLYDKIRQLNTRR